MVDDFPVSPDEILHIKCSYEEGWRSCLQPCRHLRDVWRAVHTPIRQWAGIYEWYHRQSVILWPGLKIVHGKPRQSQSQGSVECANQDIENMLACWMADPQTDKWSDGLRFIQFQKNKTFHRGNQKDAIYEAMSGCAPKVGVCSSSIAAEV